MLVHIVCWKYRPEIDGSVRDEHRGMLNALAGVIPEIVSLEVGADMLHLDRSFDTGLVARFNDVEGLNAYTIHPEHQKVAAFGKEISERTVSVDFIV